MSKVNYLLSLALTHWIMEVDIFPALNNVDIIG